MKLNEQSGVLMKSEEEDVLAGTSPAGLTQFEYCFFENMKLEALELWGEKADSF